MLTPEGTAIRTEGSAGTSYTCNYFTNNNCAIGAAIGAVSYTLSIAFSDGGFNN